MKSWIVIRPQGIPISFRLERRVPLVLLAIALITLLTMVLNISQGEYPVPLLDVVKTVLMGETENSDYNFIINTLRLPRVLVAFLVGVGLAISGAILQCLTRNPLAAPGIIGVNAGATLAAVALTVLFPTAPIFMLPLLALGGAISMTILIYLLAWERGSSTIHLILIGIGLSAIASALTTLMITFGDINQVSVALIWMAGSVYGRSWEHLWPLLPWLIIFVPLALLLSRDLNALHLGEDVARGIGSPIELRRGLLWITSLALAAASVATVGTVGFVGFISPHLARQLVGPSHEGLIPTAGMVGGSIVVFADLVGRSLFAPTELPCGVITASIGAPYFLYLLSRSNRR